MNAAATTIGATPQGMVGAGLGVNSSAGLDPSGGARFTRKAQAGVMGAQDILDQRMTAQVGVTEQERKNLIEQSLAAFKALLEMILKLIQRVVAMIFSLFRVKSAEKEKDSAKAKLAEPAVADELVNERKEPYVSGLAPSPMDIDGDVQLRSASRDLAAPAGAVATVVQSDTPSEPKVIMLGEGLDPEQYSEEVQRIVEESINGLGHVLRERVSDPDAHAELRRMMENGQSDEAAAGLMRDLVQGLQAEIQQVRQTIASDLHSLLTERVPDQKVRQAAIEEIIEGLPAAGAHSVLPMSTMEQVRGYLRNNKSLALFVVNRVMQREGKSIVEELLEPRDAHSEQAQPHFHQRPRSPFGPGAKSAENQRNQAEVDDAADPRGDDGFSRPRG